MLLSSHTLDEVQRVADRVAIIREGRLVVTDTVEHLRAEAPRILILDFAAPVDADLFTRLDGVGRVDQDGARVHLQLTGEVAPVLRLALDHDLVDLVARHADLDELFLAYYRSPDPGGEPDAA